MIEVKTADLIGPVLRYAVAAACGWRLERIEDGAWNAGEPHWWRATNPRRITETRNGLVGYIKPGAKGVTSNYDYCPDVDWQIGGPLIEHFKVSVVGEDREHTVFVAMAFFDGKTFDSCYKAQGPTHLVAACRAIVRAKLGDAVSVPAELVQGGGS